MPMDPLVFEPFLRPMVWGGRRLASVLGKALPAEGTFGESWEISGHPQHVSRIAEGPLSTTQRVSMTFMDMAPAVSQVEAGSARALATTNPDRASRFPDIPTMKEGGVAFINISAWTGLFAPRDTPPAIVKKLEGELMRIARLPDVIARLKPLGIESVGTTSDEFTRVLAADIARWGEVAKTANIRIEQ